MYVLISQHIRLNEPALSCMESSGSVLVSSRTSAGKTAIAEYVIDQSLKNKQKVIYTSPIKVKYEKKGIRIALINLS